MSWFRKQIHRLQNRSYQFRVRFLWTAVGITGIIILAVWLLTLRYRNLPANSSHAGFDEIWANLKKIKDIRP